MVINELTLLEEYHQRYLEEPYDRVLREYPLMGFFRVPLGCFGVPLGRVIRGTIGALNMHHV